MEEKPRFLSRAYSDSSTKMERKRVDMNCANYKIKINFWKCVQISYTRSNSMRDCPTQYCSDDKIKNGKWSCAQYFKDSCGSTLCSQNTNASENAKEEKKFVKIIIYVQFWCPSWKCSKFSAKKGCGFGFLIQPFMYEIWVTQCERRKKKFFKIVVARPCFVRNS